MQFLDKLFMPVVVGKPVETPQVLFFFFSCRCVWWRWPDNAEYCGEWTSSCHARLCLVPMARQRGNCGDSTAAVLGQGTCLLSLVWCRWPDSAENCGYAAVAVLRSRCFPCRAAKAYPHGLACSEDHRDSAVQYVAWWSIPLLCRSCWIFRREMLKTVEVPQCSSSTWVVLFMRTVEQLWCRATD